MGRRERGLFEWIRADPERARAEARALWPGRGPLDRRRFLWETGAGLGLALAAVFPDLSGPRALRDLSASWVPAAFAGETPFALPGKDPGLVVLNDRPLNVETPAHLLDDALTPTARLFVRNNGIPPSDANPESWTIRIDGEAAVAPRVFSIAELKTLFDHHRYRLQIECGGNGRSEFVPAARGNQWTTGAVGCVEWTGVRLRDVLEAVGLRGNAIYIGYEGSDRHLSGDPGMLAISRGVPIAKALQDETLIAWSMNGAAIPPLHGAPLRLVCGGWPASTSGKWLRRIRVRDRVHDGEKMGGQSYRVPCEPVAPGSKVSDEDMCIIESMPVKSLITFPRSGIVHPLGMPLQTRGAAWAGELAVASVELSIDFGQTWLPTPTEAAPNRLAWQRWHAVLRFPGPGYYEVWARATDTRGRTQPLVLPGWNPKGYLNNAAHRIALRVTA